MPKKEIKEVYRVYLHEYQPIDKFEKRYKLLAKDKDGNEIFTAMDITSAELNFEFTFRNYERAIWELEAKIDLYQKLIDKFQDKLKITVEE